MNTNETIKEATKSVWGASPAGWTYGEGHQKGTKEFFQSVLHKRFNHECDWMQYPKTINEIKFFLQ